MSENVCLKCIPVLTYTACVTFTKNKERKPKFNKTGDSLYIYQNELDNGCFQHEMAYEDFKDSTRRTAFDKILHDKTFNIAKNPKYDECQRGLASIVYKFFDKKSSSSGIKNEIISNKELADKLHKPIMINFMKRKVHSTFIDNIWGADDADM